MRRTHFVYGLHDSGDSEIRYVGLTIDPLKRLRSHSTARPIPFGRRLYYRGKELIAWLEKQQTRTNREQTHDQDRQCHSFDSRGF